MQISPDLILEQFYALKIKDRCAEIEAKIPSQLRFQSQLHF